MSEKESSDEEDVFECGRCKEKFTDMTVFMCHKREKACQKVKNQMSSTRDSGIRSEKPLLADTEGLAPSPMKDDIVTSTGNLSPSISDIFSSKSNSKSIESSSVSMELLSTLDQVSKPLQDTSLVECALCQEWYPNQTILDVHLQDKHGLVSQANLGQMRKVTHAETTASKENVSGDSSTPAAMIVNKKTSRRARPDYSCTICNLKFLSKFKLQQHLSSRKHQTTVKRQTLEAEGRKGKKRHGKQSKKGICPVCRMSKQSLKELNKHIREAHGDYKGKENKDSREKRTTSEPSKNLCRECGSLVPTRSLKRHERRCANRKLYECPLCKHQSREKTDFKSHIDSHMVWIETQVTDVHWESVEPSNQKEASEATDAVKADVDDRSRTLTLSAADLAVLGLMPKHQSLVENFDALEPGLKKLCEPDHVSDKEKSEGEDTGDNPDADKNVSSSTRVHPRQLKCKLCVKWFVRSDLTKHMLDKHRMVKQFQCRDLNCLETFTDLDIFKTHIASHSEKLMFQCGCRHCLPNRRNVEPDYPEGMRKWKMRQYYSQLSFKCNVCWMKFPSEGRLLRHQQTDTHRHECDKCGKVSVSKRQLRLHKQVHIDERGYLCDMCGSGFKTDRDLKRHIASHSSERPFVCNNCGKGFIFKNKLTRHCNTVHATKKPHKCDQPGCKKTFARKDKLREHLNTHKSIPPYVCKYCKKTFCRKDSVRDHEILTHTKEYPYSCRLCNKGFIRPKILQNHETTEHGKQSETDSLLKHVKVQVQSDVQQHGRNSIASSMQSSAASSGMSYVIFDRNMGAVLQATNDREPQSLQTLRPMTFTPGSNNEAPSSELPYQMTDITGNATSNLAYQMANTSCIGLPDSQHTIQVALTNPLAPTDSDTV